MKHACNKREKAAARPRCFRLKTSGGAVTAHFGSFNSPLFFLVTNEFIHPLRSDEPAFRLNPPQSPRELERRRNNGGRHGDRDESNEETTAERDAGWGGDAAPSGRRFGKASSMCDGCVIKVKVPLGRKPHNGRLQHHAANGTTAQTPFALSSSACQPLKPE